MMGLLATASRIPAPVYMGVAIIALWAVQSHRIDRLKADVSAAKTHAEEQTMLREAAYEAVDHAITAALARSEANIEANEVLLEATQRNREGLAALKAAITQERADETSTYATCADAAIPDRVLRQLPE